MKNYIKNNITPILIGLISGILFMNIINIIDDIIIKIFLINH